MPEPKKVVIKVDVHDDKDKRKAMKAVSSLSGINSLAIDMKDKKLTIIGDIDPVEIVEKLKKWPTEILTVGPAKEDKKDDKKKDDDKKDDKKKREEEEEEALRRWLAYRAYNPYMGQQYYVRSVDDYHPNDNCVIC